MKILITGDFIVDRHIVKGNRMHTSSSAMERGTQILEIKGGAYLTYELVKSISEGLAVDISTNLMEKEFETFITDHPEYVSYIEWEKHKCKKNAEQKKLCEKKWDYTPLGYGSHIRSNSDLINFLSDNYNDNELIIIDEANLGYRNQELLIKNKTVFMKMAFPFCQGKVWNNLMKEKNTVFTIVTLENLRRYDVKVSKAISWEQTALDLCFEITQNVKLKELLHSSYVIVLIGSAGALCIKPDEKECNTSFELIFDPVFMEDEWEQINGTSIGSGSAFISGFFLGYLKACFEFKVKKENKDKEFEPVMMNSIISTGLNHVRILNEAGLLFAEDLVDLPFPFAKLKTATSGFPYYFSNAYVPSPYNRQVSHPVEKLETGQSEIERKINYLKNAEWTILENNYFIWENKNKGRQNKSPEPFFPLARNIAFKGPCMAQYAPMIHFGNFFSFDRSEIESLRNIKQLILDYDENKEIDHPLNLAVFGAPGAGKSFAIKQIANSVFNNGKTQILEYNLSQFNHPSQLIGAYHSVRDAVLKGKLPLVFWDEFDSNNLSWLKELIAPMQDGKFLENGIIHSLGKCIFVFAGATSYTMESFDPVFKLNRKSPKAKEKQEILTEDFRMKKGPDFLSRINGFLNVQGPNRRLIYNREAQEWTEDPSDVCFPVRRALFLRGVLKLKDGEELKTDWGIISAFLELSKYVSGSRSLERLLSQLTLRSRDNIVRSNLPSDEIISLNVDFMDFMEKMYRNRKNEEFSEKLAVNIHNTWKEMIVKDSSFYNEYMKLNYNGRKSNIAAALRIFEIVEKTGRFKIQLRNDLLCDASGEFDEYIKISENMEKLAEMEHIGWIKERTADGWSIDPDLKGNWNDYLRFHPCLKPYTELNENEKEKDRNSIRKYVDFFKNSDFMITT